MLRADKNPRSVIGQGQRADLRRLQSHGPAELTIDALGDSRGFVRTGHALEHADADSIDDLPVQAWARHEAVLADGKHAMQRVALKRRRLVGQRLHALLQRESIRIEQCAGGHRQPG